MKNTSFGRLKASVVVWLLVTSAPALTSVTFVLALVAAPSLHAQQVTTLYSFLSGTDACTPTAGLIRDGTGNLYGTTYNGGTFGHGTVFKLTPSGSESILYSFGSSATDAFTPTAAVVRDGAGNLYGTTLSGGMYGLGTVYKVPKTGLETVLYSFADGNSGGTDGFAPYSTLVRDSAGNLYGTTTGGGPDDYGTVFQVTASGTEIQLHAFVGADGADPVAGLIRDSAGNLYGTATEAGVNGNFGTVFEVSPAGVETTLFSFDGADGQSPYGGLIRDSKGNFYGTTETGGAFGYGTVYELTPSGVETVLYHFTGGADGGYPKSTLVRDSSGNVYGTTTIGGTDGGECGAILGCGVVFEVSKTGVETVLHAFAGFPTEGQTPDSGLVMDNSGNLYGTTSGGGASGCGTVFEVTPPNFQITASPTSATVTAGQSTTSTLTLTPVGEFNGTVNLSCTVPKNDGLSCSVLPNSITLDGVNSQKATLTMNTSPTTPPGTYKIVSKGISGSLTHTANFTLTVQ